MKRRNDEKDMFCSSRSKLDPIQLIDEKEDRSGMKVDDPIPVDLEVDILTRLPAKSVIKFLCVSKMWFSIIRSQRFVNSYYAMSSTIRSRFIITISGGALRPQIDDRCLFVFSSSYETEISSCLSTNLDMKIPSVPGLFNSAAYCASVHGLVGFTTSGFTFTVCNPSINKFTILPCIGARTSWGYDPLGDQFKALTMVSYPYRPPNFIAHEVLTLGGAAESNKVISPPYFGLTKSVCINGFVYYGAWTPTRSQNPVIVCFDVRHEKFSFIKAPLSVDCWEGESILINYKEKLAAAIARHPYALFQSFDLWILEDVKKQDWSIQSFQLPLSLGMGKNFTSPGTNKGGEIIFAPILLPFDAEPFYIFYYNVDRKDIRRVRLLGIADDQDFRRRYGISRNCYVSISAQHVESIASL